MKNLLPLFALLVLAPAAAAGGDVYRALLDGRIRALVTVQSENGQDSGSVDYDAGGGGDLFLRGNRAPDGGFRWEEYLWNRGGGADKPTGRFTGRLAADGKSGDGVWSTVEGRKKFDFTLTRVAAGRTLKDPEVDASVSWPELDDPRYARLNGQMAERARKDLAKHAADLKTSREELKSIDNAAVDHLTMATDCSMAGLEPEAVSLYCSVYEYLGGAHGNTEVEPRNFAIAADGAVTRLGLWDLLAKSRRAEQAVSRLLVADLRRQRATSVVRGEIKDFVDALASDGIPFTIGPAGLAFHFPPYAVGPYSDGAFEVLVPNRALAPYLKPGGVLAGRSATP
jgi:hypothetical protein